MALACAAAAVSVALVAVIPAIEAGGGVDALVRLPAEEPLGRLVADRDPGFDFVEGAARYDGLYFYAFALDPFATGAEHQMIDAPAYRYGHAGYGWVAAIASFGNEGWIPMVLLLLSLLGMALAAGTASLLAGHFGLTPWIGLTVAVNPGLVYAVTSDTSEAFAAGVLGAGLLLWLRGNIRWGGVLLIALCLIKEPFVVVPLGLGVWEAIEYRRGRSAPDLWNRVGWLAAGPIALGAWFVYLQAKFGVWPFAEGPENIGLPITGWIETLRLASEMSLDPGAYQVGAASLPLLVAAGTAIVVGCLRAARFRSPLDPIFLGLAAIVFSLTWLALLFPKDMMRNVSASFYLLPLVLIGTARVGRSKERKSEGSHDVEEGHRNR